MINKYRPSDLEHFLDNKITVKTIKTAFKNNSLPHGILLIGEPGCGKTTLARIIKNMLKCHDSAYYEVNCGTEGGKEKTLQLIEKMRTNPLLSDTAVFTLDEAQKLTTSSQTSLLKPTEEPNSNVYIIFCSTDPSKIESALKSRLTKYRLQPIHLEIMKNWLLDIWIKETYPQNNNEELKIIEKIAQKSNGIPRDALTLLSQLRTLDLSEAQEILQNYTMEESEIIGLARMILKGTDWNIIAQTFIKLQKSGKNYETIRIILGKYFKGTLLKSGRNDRIYKLVELFSTPVDSNIGDIKLISMLYKGCFL